MKYRLALLLLCLFAPVPSIYADHGEGDSTRLVGSYPFGPADSIAYDRSRNLYYVGSGAGVMTMDFSVPNDPTILSESIRATKTVRSILYDDTEQRLYVAAVDLFVWDVSTPSAPVMLGKLAHNSSLSPVFAVSQIAKQGNMIFATSGTSVHAIDVTDPTAPTLKASYAVPSRSTGGLSLSLNGIVAKGSFFFVTGTQSDLKAFEYTPDNRIVFYFDSGWSAESSGSPYIVDNTLYFKRSLGGLSYVDISDPRTLPVISGIPQYEQYGAMLGIVDKSTALIYSGNSTDGYLINTVNITDPTNLQSLSSYALPTQPYPAFVVALASSSSQAVVITKYHDFIILDIGATKTLAQSATYMHNTGVTTNIELQDSLGYLSQPSVGVQVIDYSDLTNPTRITTIPSNESSIDAVPQGKYTYLLDRRVVRVFDSTDPAAPVEISSHSITPPSYRPEAFPTSLDIDGNVLMLSIGREVEIVDISLPSNPVFASRYVFPEQVTSTTYTSITNNAYDVNIQGNIAYISTTDGLFSLDIANLTSPKLLDHFAYFINYETVIRGNLAYGISAGDGMYILDVSNPANIRLINNTNIFRTARAITVGNGFAYVANTYDGLQIFDVTNPASPTLVGLYIDKNLRSLAAKPPYVITTGNYITSKVVENLLDTGVTSPTNPGPNPDPGSDPVPDPEPDPTPAPNQPPVADAGDDQRIKSKDETELDGSRSTDPEGTIVAYLWEQISGRSVEIDNPDEAVAIFEAPKIRRGTTRTLEFRLTVTDDQGATNSDSVIVTVYR